jgi:hypothetical protein
MGTVGIQAKARGALPKSLRRKVCGPEQDLETLTAMLEGLERPNRSARRALERVTTKRQRKERVA